MKFSVRLLAVKIYKLTPVTLIYALVNMNREGMSSVLSEKQLTVGIRLVFQDFHSLQCIFIIKTFLMVEMLIC